MFPRNKQLGLPAAPQLPPATVLACHSCSHSGFITKSSLKALRRCRRVEVHTGIKIRKPDASGPCSAAGTMPGYLRSGTSARLNGLIRAAAHTWQWP